MQDGDFNKLVDLNFQSVECQLCLSVTNPKFFLLITTPHTSIILNTGQLIGHRNDIHFQITAEKSICSIVHRIFAKMKHTNVNLIFLLSLIKS
jgi:hypothetical protein